MLLRLGVCLAGCFMLMNLAEPAPAQIKKASELIKILTSDKNPKDRIFAAEEIGNLAAIKLSEAASALPALRSVLQKETDPNVRKAVLATIGKIEPENYVELLIETFKKDRDPTIHLAIVTALGQLGPKAKEALPVLHDALQKHQAQPPTNTPMVKSPPAPDPHAVPKAIISVLTKIQPEPKEYVPVLLEVLKKDKEPTVRLAAVTALGQLGPKAKDTVPALQEALKSAIGEAQRTPLPAGVTDTDAPGLRKGILAVLLRIVPEPKEQVPMLIDALKRDREPSVRLTAVNALGRIGAPAKSAVPVLLDVQKSSLAAKADTDPQGLRKTVLEVLPKLDADPKSYLAILNETLRKDREPKVQLFAVQAVGQMGSAGKSSVPALKDLLHASITAQPKTDAQGVRQATLEALDRIEPEGKIHVPILIDVLQRDRDAAVRLAAVKSLGLIGPGAKSAVPFLLELQKQVGTDAERAQAREVEAAVKKIRGN